MNSSVDDESTCKGILSICKSVGNSALSLVAALINLFSEEGVVSIPKKFFIAFTPPNLSLNVFGRKKLSVCFVKGTHQSPL